MKIIFFLMLSFATFCQTYNANILGQKLQDQTAPSDYKVQISSRTSKNTRIETSTLYFQNILARKWIRYYDRINDILFQEKEYLKDIILFDRSYDIFQNITKELVYGTTKDESDKVITFLKETIFYTYKDDLVIKKVFNVAKSPINPNPKNYTELYFYTYGGNLRNVSKIDGEASSYYRYGYYQDNTLKREWMNDEGGTKKTNYDTMGRIDTINIDNKGEMGDVFYKYEYAGDSKRPSFEYADYTDGYKTTKGYDTNGNLISNDTYFEKKLVSSERMTYNSQNQLIKEVIREDKNESTYLYSYRNGEMSSITKMNKGSIEKITQYQSKSQWVDMIFKKGKMVLKVYYLDSKIKRQEEIRNGRVVSKIDYDY